MRAAIAIAYLILGIVMVVALVVACAAVVIGVLWWIWTQDVTAARVAGTGLFVAALVWFTAPDAEGP